MSLYKLVTRIVPLFTGSMLLSLHINAEPYQVMFEPGVSLPEITINYRFGKQEKVVQNIDQGKRIVDRLSMTTDREMRVGEIRYQNNIDKGRYGSGFRNYFGGKEENVVLSNSGLMFAGGHSHIMYNLSVKNEEPENERETIYVQFSLMKKW